MGLFVFVVVCSVSTSISQTCYWISVGAGGRPGWTQPLCDLGWMAEGPEAWDLLLALTA